MKFFLQLGQFSLYLAQNEKNLSSSFFATNELCNRPKKQDTANDSETYLERVTVTGIKSSLINDRYKEKQCRCNGSNHCRRFW